MHHRSNWEDNLTYMEEEESNGSFLDTWARFPNIYDTNDEDSNFEGERFPSKLVFREATQVFHVALMELYF